MRESNNVSEEDGEQSERCLDVDQRRRRRGARRTKSAQCEEEVERNGGEMAGSRTAALHFQTCFASHTDETWCHVHSWLHLCLTRHGVTCCSCRLMLTLSGFVGT